MKILKFNELFEQFDDLDPYNEEDWDEVGELTRCPACGAVCNDGNKINVRNIDMRRNFIFNKESDKIRNISDSEITTLKSLICRDCFNNLSKKQNKNWKYEDYSEEIEKLEKNPIESDFD